MDTRLVAVIVIAVAVAGPLLAYAVYPGEPPVEDVVGEEAPAFVKAVSHCRVYGGTATLTGRVVDVRPPVVLVRGDDGVLYRVVLGGCWVSSGKLLLDALTTGARVVVEGSVYTMHGTVLVKPHRVAVDGEVYVQADSCPGEATTPMPHHCPMCPHP